MGNDNELIAKIDAIYADVCEIKDGMRDLRNSISEHNTRITRVEVKTDQHYETLSEIKSAFHHHFEDDERNFRALRADNQATMISIAKILGGLIVLSAIAPYLLKILWTTI